MSSIAMSLAPRVIATTCEHRISVTTALTSCRELGSRIILLNLEEFNREREREREREAEGQGEGQREREKGGQ